MDTRRVLIMEVSKTIVAGDLTTITGGKAIMKAAADQLVAAGYEVSISTIQYLGGQA